MGSISDSDSNDDLEEVSSRQSQVHERLIVFRDLLRFMIFLDPINITMTMCWVWVYCLVSIWLVGL